MLCHSLSRYIECYCALLFIAPSTYEVLYFKVWTDSVAGQYLIIIIIAKLVQMLSQFIHSKKFVFVCLFVCFFF